MPFKTFISSAKNQVAFWVAKIVAKAAIAVILLIGLTACSSKTAEDVSKEAERGSQSKQAIPNLAVDESVNPENKKMAKIDNNSSKAKPAINRYLQQQASQNIIIAAGVMKDYQQAVSFMNEKKWSQAEAIFDQVILKQPKLSGSYVNKAIMAKQQGKLIEAQTFLNQAITANNLNLYAHHLQGQIYRLQGQFDKAEQSYLAALAIWPDFAEAHASMAILLELYRGRLLDAHNHYSAYLMLNADDEEVKRWQAGLEIKIKRAGLTVPITEKNEVKGAEQELADSQVVLSSGLKQEVIKQEIKEQATKSQQTEEEKNNG